MTAGQILVGLSGLSGVAASAHLQAITPGGGAVQTIFASRFSVRAESPELIVSERKKQVLIEVGVQPVDKAVSIKSAPLAVGEQHEETFIFTTSTRIRVFNSEKNMRVTMRVASSIATQLFGKSTVVAE